MYDLNRNLKSEDISIGIELGSTRIKTVAIDQNLNTVATGILNGRTNSSMDIGHILLMIFGSVCRKVIAQ